MIFDISKAYIEQKYKTTIWGYLGIHRSYWSQMKNKKKLSLIHYKKLCEACGIQICQDDHKIVVKMVGDYYE